MALATGMAHVHTVPGEILVGPENEHEPLAQEIRVPADRISAIVVGKRRPVTGEIALRLSPLPAYWMNLQATWKPPRMPGRKRSPRRPRRAAQPYSPSRRLASSAFSRR